MAKRLTEEEKAANKAAQKIRRAAFSARRAEYRAQGERATSEWQASPEFAAAEEAVQALEARFASYRADDDVLQAQIAALEAQRAELRAALDADVDKLRASRDAAQTASRARKKALEAQVQAAYPDMDGCWYLASWKPPAGYVEAFAQSKEKKS